MLHIKETIVVEGKYDKQRLRRITDAPIIVTGGFTLYKDKNIMKSIISAAKETGIIVLTDSDRAGFRIRNYIKQCVGKEAKVLHGYIPSISGKEKRKDAPGKEGILGVEGMDDEILLDILKKIAKTSEHPVRSEKFLTKAMLFEDGLSGKPGSEELRKKLSKKLSLPPKLSANGIIEIVNRVYGYEKYKKALDEIKEEKL